MTIAPRHNLFIDGTWTAPASNEWVAVQNPATGQRIAYVAKGNAQDVNRAVNVAQRYHHGYGDSGLRGEDGQHGLEAYVQTKTIYLNA
ncbi:hypothetical protein [Gluconobacter wancherniae]|uniref:hypothetical protein n=1 Tax=Gluconobacter wancherniae TaxID=1307955 RepID=UPI001B8BAB65|nr:hypothetical protein [Gluconobacter wancherniae]MBS1089726.1 hypothetical protein [Gluconobacter wancherniae]